MTVQPSHRHGFWIRFMSLLVAEAFLCSSVLPAWATPLPPVNRSALRPAVARDGGDMDGLKKDLGVDERLAARDGGEIDVVKDLVKKKLEELGLSYPDPVVEELAQQAVEINASGGAKPEIEVISALRKELTDAGSSEILRLSGIASDVAEELPLAIWGGIFSDPRSAPSLFAEDIDAAKHRFLFLPYLSGWLSSLGSPPLQNIHPIQFSPVSVTPLPPP